MAAHFAYGAAMSSLVAVAPGAAAPIAGAGYGLLIWAGSYLGRLPSIHILKSATRHPPQRNALMGVVHLVWGAGTSVTSRELLRAQSEVFADGELRDARADRPRPGLDLTNRRRGTRLRSAKAALANSPDYSTLARFFRNHLGN